MKYANCHPDRKHKAKGLCKPCYRTEYYKSHSEEKKIYDAERYKNHGEERAKYCKEHHEEKKLYGAEYRKNHREKANIYGSEYYKNHREEKKTQQVEYYKNNLKKIKTKLAEYAKNNPGKINAKAARRRAQKRQATPKWLTRTHWKEIQSLYIEASNKTKKTNIKYHVDHIFPLQAINDKGEHIGSGFHVPWNLRIVTATQNCSDGAKLIPKP